MTAYQVLRPARSEFIALREQRYHVRCWEDASGEKPLLVLLHGWMDVGASWQFLVDALPARFTAGRRIIAPDWRGFGRTSGPPCDHYLFADYLGDLEALIDHYAAGLPVDLVGHSMGGNVAMMYAGARPERVRHVVNLEGFGMPQTEPEEAPGRYARWLDDLAALRHGKFALRNYPDAAAVAARLMKTNPRLAPAKAAWLAREWAEPRQDADGCLHWHILAQPAHRVVSVRLSPVAETLALYRAIRAPILMIEASDDSLAQWAKGRYSRDEFHERLRSARSVERHTLPDCGHMLHHDRPGNIANLLVNFLGHA